MRINLLVISNNRFCICFKSSPPKPVIYFDSCLKMSSLVVTKKDRRDRRKYNVFARSGHNSQFQELEPVRKKNTLEVCTNEWL